MDHVLSVEGLSKSFGDVRAVAGLSFDVSAGEVYGLIGPDGAGKTTAMRVVAGLLRPDEGSIVACGHRVPGEERALHRVMGYMPQQYSLYGDLSVEENLRFFAGMYGVPASEIPEREARLLDMARLGPFGDRIAGALSGGMYKKLALSCALVHRPRLALLDEPTNGVDPISRRELWAFLAELVREGVAVVISTPYMDEAERCDRVGLIVEGRIVSEGRPADLRRGFSETVFEIEAAPQHPARLAIAALDGVSRVYTVGKRIHAVSREGEGAGARIGEALAGAGVSVSSISAVPPSFEDIFLGVSAGAADRKGGA